MPIPPRPIPKKQRPGHQVPRKLPSTPHSLISDGKAEMAFLGSAVGGGRVIRAGGNDVLGGVRMAVSLEDSRRRGSSAIGVSGLEDGEEEQEGKEEVGIEGIIYDCRNKREKRATTATTLGFQMIPNPTIITFPNDDSTSRTQSRSLLSTIIPYSKSSAARTAHKSNSASPADSVVATPVTPGLLATHLRNGHISSASSGEDEEEEDDWEHVSVSSEFDGEDKRGKGGEDDGDIIVLGELELEDGDRVGLVGGKGKAGKEVEQIRSYAAALGKGSVGGK